MGVKTLYEYFYKLAYGDKGADKATLVNDCLDVADAEIKANKDAKHIGEDTSTFIIYKDVSYTYAIDGHTGNIVSQNANATVVLQYAHDNLPTEGGTIYIKSGVYIITDAISHTHKRVRWEGAGGWSTQLKLEDAANCNMFELSGASCYYPQFVNLSLDGNVANQGVVVNAINIAADAYCVDFHLIGNLIVYFDNGIYWVQDVTNHNSIWHTYISANTIEHCNLRPIDIQARLDDLFIIGNDIKLNIDGVSITGYDISNQGKGFYIKDNWIESGKHGIEVDFAKQILIQGNNINASTDYDGTYTAIKVGSTSGDIDNILIQNNISLHVYQNYGVYLYACVNNVTISDNFLYGDISNVFLGTATNVVYYENVSGKLAMYSPIDLTSGQIAFPATQVPSANANTLDDYEEGAWTPTITFGGASVGITYTYQSGLYTKIGRQVTITGFIKLSNKGTSTGTVLITALPFTSKDDYGAYSAISLRFKVITFANVFQGYIAKASTSINLREVIEDGTETLLDDTNFANTSEIVFSATYFTD